MLLNPAYDGGYHIEHDYLIEVIATYKAIYTELVHAYYQTNFTSADDTPITTSCDRPGFEVGETCFIYAFLDHDRRLGAYLGGCALTRLFEEADISLKALGPGTKPGALLGMPVAGMPTPKATSILAVALILLTAGIAMMRFRDGNV
jgi:hypothetical protein